MKKMSYWSITFTFFALIVDAVGGIATPATATGNTTTAYITQQSQPASGQLQGNFQLAQGLVGQCRRAAKERIFVYSQRSTNSQAIRTLARNERVTLADNGGGGWIAISSPVTGFVQATNLAQCPGDGNTTPSTGGSTTPSTGNLCRRVTYKGSEGLAIRSKASSNSTRVAGVRFGDKVTLRAKSSPVLDNQGRAWVEITAPATGWISSGFPSQKATNIGSCP